MTRDLRDTRTLDAFPAPRLCNWPGCHDVAAEMPFWACREHWHRLPENLRRDLIRAYPGTLDYRNVLPREWLAACNAARRYFHFLVAGRIPTRYRF